MNQCGDRWFLARNLLFYTSAPCPVPQMLLIRVLPTLGLPSCPGCPTNLPWEALLGVKEKPHGPEYCILCSFKVQDQA